MTPEGSPGDGAGPVAGSWEPSRAADRRLAASRRGAVRTDSDRPLVAASAVTGLVAVGVLVAAVVIARSWAAALAALALGVDVVVQLAVLAAARRERRVERLSGPATGRRGRFYWPAVLGAAAAAAALAWALPELVPLLGDRDSAPGDVATGLAAGALAVALVVKGLTAFLSAATLAAGRGSFVPDPEGGSGPGGTRATQVLTWVLVQLRRGPHPAVGMAARQDVTAVLGLAAVAGLTLAGALLPDVRYDGWAAAAALGWLSTGFVAHLLHMHALVVGGAVPLATREAVAAVVEVQPSVRRLVHLEAHHVGPDEVQVAVRVQLVADLVAAEVAEVVDRLRLSVEHAVPAARSVYVDPEITAPPPAPPPAGFATGGTYVLPAEGTALPEGGAALPEATT